MGLDIPESLWKSIYPKLAVKLAGKNGLPTNMGKQSTSQELEYVLKRDPDFTMPYEDFEKN